MITLLNKNSLTARGQFQPVSMSLSLSERQSTATVTVGPDSPAIAVGDWMRDDTEPGKGIVWRAKSVETDYSTNTRTVQLEHIINVLKDTVMFGEVTPETMGGSATSVTAKKAASYIISRQSDWKLGSVGYTTSQGYNFNSENLYSALETVSGTLADCWWSYDLSVYPFVLYIKPIDKTVSCEMRMDRNIRTLRRTIDKSQMYTRVYPIGKNNLHISGSYVQKNQGTYGVISKVLTDTSKETASALKTWATERLNRHCEPSVTVTISGLELSSVTGLAMDRLTLGKWCQVPLPEYGTTIAEKICKLNWSDKIADPESVTVTLANELVDTATIIRTISESVSSGTGGRGTAKKQEEDHAWFEDTTDHVAMVAEAVGGKDANGNPDWSRVSKLTVDGNGIVARVEKTEGDMVTATSEIVQHEDFISQTVKAIGKDGKITAASITAAVNNGSSNIYINADHVRIGSTKLSTVLSIESGMVRINKQLLTGKIVADGNITAPDFRISLGESEGSASLKQAYHGVTLTRSGNTYELTLWPMDGNVKSTDKVTFSRATSLSGAWSGGRFTVSASPQGNSIYSELVLGTVSWSGATATITLDATLSTDSSEQLHATGKTVKVTAPLQTKSISNNGTFTPDSDYAGFSSVTVSGVRTNSMSITQAIAGVSSSGTTYYGRMYYYNSNTGSYVAAATSNYYWYRSSTNKSGTSTVYY